MHAIPFEHLLGRFGNARDVAGTGTVTQSVSLIGSCY